MSYSAMNAPLPYQIEGIDFLTGSRAAILGDDAGLGKSLQMIRAANNRGAERILVICPAVGRVSWAIQFKEWDLAPRPVLLYPDDLPTDQIPLGPLALIVTVDWLSDKKRAKRFLTALSCCAAIDQPFDTAFIDEAHYLKSHDANRTKAVYGPDMDRRGGAIEDVEMVWAASATITPLNASELYPHLRALLPGVLRGLFNGTLPTFRQFRDRFCVVRATTYGEKIEGNNPKTIPELRDAIRAIYLGRLKQDVLPQLGPIITDTLALELPRPLNAATQNNHATAGICGLSDEDFLRALSRQMRGGDGNTDDDTDETDTTFSEQRRVLGEGKADAFAPWLRDFLTANPDRKLIVFAHHRSVIDRVMQAGKAFGPVAIHGGTSRAQDALSVSSFQNSLACRLLVGQTRAAGTSITLTASSDVVILEPDPSPLNNYQAISRAHRLGQTRGSVTARFAAAISDPIDMRLAQIIRRRANDYQDLFGAYVPH
jgi:SWI/SNF-related matrix-associated actin-dependent regulator of chromatin subfamily A-like protein 1